MSSLAVFFRHIGAHRVKTAGGRLHLPQVIAALNRLGLEHGVIDPEIAAAHGVLPKNIVLPKHEPPAPPPPIGVEELAKEEVLALLRNATTPPAAIPAAVPAAVPATPEAPVEGIEPLRLEPPAIDE